MKSNFFTSSLGQKFFVGITGLGLSLFLAAHMAGNLLLFFGEKAYNLYSHALITNPLTIVIEIFLALSFTVHIIWALFLTLINKTKKGPSLQKDSHNSIIHKTLWLQGSIILVFVILHLITFKYGTIYTVEYEGLVVRDLFRLVSEVFQKPLYASWYVFSLIILSFHLSHGLQASIKSLGFYTPWLKKASVVYAFIVILGFISQALFFLFFH